MVSTSSERPAPTSPDAEDLAAPQGKADVLYLPPHRNIARFQDHVPDFGLGLGKHILDIAADHHADERLLIKVRGLVAADELAVAQHGDSVANAEYLVHLV